MLSELEALTIDLVLGVELDTQAYIGTDAEQDGPLVCNSWTRDSEFIDGTPRYPLRRSRLSPGQKVFLASEKRTKKVVALKIVRKRDLLTEAPDRILAEQRVLQMAAGSPFLAKGYGAFQTPIPCCGDSVRAPISPSTRHCSSLHFYLRSLINYKAYDISLYRDIKPRNIMLDDVGHIKIGDFGLALEMHSKKTAKGYAGTEDYMAPEMRKGKKYNAAVDWWAYGLILHKLAKRAFPKNPSAAQSMLRDTTNHHECQRNHVKDLLKKLLCKNPTERLGAANNIRAHPFFQSIDWDELEAGMVDPPFALNTPSLESLISKVIKETTISTYEAFTPPIPSEEQQLFIGFSFNILSQSTAAL
ncbi:protein kinase C theta type-like [Pelobates fuscus]|uniref:protein kinase C theta type-like n=1 Tax=Pelobates fuscus TaxID=191477 RepID=UPI002FE4E53D